MSKRAGRVGFGHRLRTLDWEAIAGIAAAVLALVLHLFHVAEAGVLLAIMLVILALMLIRDLHREGREERMLAAAERTEDLVERLQATLKPADAVLIGSPRLRGESERFARRARGDMTWFNVCLRMFVRQELFDALLAPAVENPAVSAIQFVLDVSERPLWEGEVAPKVATCAGREKVREPRWCQLKESVSFILSEMEPAGAMEAHLSFWGEPFMARTAGLDVPRYVFHVQAHSELIGRLVELERHYRGAVARIEA